MQSLKLAALELDTLELHPELPTTASARLRGGEGTGEQCQVQPLMGRVTNLCYLKVIYTQLCIYLSS